MWNLSEFIQYEARLIYLRPSSVVYSCQNWYLLSVKNHLRSLTQR